MVLVDFFPFCSFLFFSILIFGRALLLRKRGVRVNSKSKKKTKSKFVLSFLFLLIMHLWMFEISQPLFHISILPKKITSSLIESVPLQIAGMFFIILALGALLFTLVSFQNSLRFGMHSNNLGKLITNGIFAFSRNPFFISIALYFIGIALLLPSLFLIGFAILTLIAIHFFILKEERFMKENYGEEYKKYTEKVKRYF